MPVAVQAAAAVMAGVATLVLVNEAQKRRWAAGYFTPMALIIGFGHYPSLGWREVGAKVAMPAAAGAVTAVLAPSEPVILAALAGLAGGLTLSWPILLVPDTMPEEMYGRETELRLLHLMYAATSSLLALSGGILVAGAVAIGGEALIDFGLDVVRQALAQFIVAAIAFLAGALLMRSQLTRARGLQEWSETWYDRQDDERST